MEVLLRKSPFCTKLTQILNLEETEIHYGQSLVMTYSNTSNEGIWPQKFSNSINDFETMCLNLFQIQNLCKFGGIQQLRGPNLTQF